MKLITFILYIISFLDSVSFGLIMPVLPIHILILGGTHTILGVHGMLHMSLQLFSGPLSRTCNERFGKKFTLKTTLLLGIISNVLMGIYPSYVFVIVLRVILYLSNQTQNLVRSFVDDVELKENHNSVISKLNLLGIFGFIVGPIIGGYVFELSNGFLYLSLMTGTLSFISLVLCSFLPQDIPPKAKKQKNTTLNEKVMENIKSSVEAFRSVDINKNRTILLLRSLISFSLTIFFIKFSLLLKIHYLASHPLIGWTIAYQNVAMFLSTVSIPFLENKVTVKNIYRLRRFLSILAISATAICFAPTYEIYLLSFVPLAIAKAFVDSAWKDIENTQEKNSAQFQQVLKTVADGTNIFAPIVLGIFCDIYLQNAVKMLTIIPLVLASFLGSYYYVSPVKITFDKKK